MKSNLWHLERIVTGTLWGSVVAKMNLTWEGGSSSVFRRALNASFVSMWTSSMIYTLYLLDAGINLIFSLSSLISSMPRFDAPSISWTSIDDPFVTSLHE